MSLPCGCDPSLEGGYGDDGTHSRYSIDWCPLHAKAEEMRELLASMNHMGGDERGGYCICPINDGSAPDVKHATICAEARALLAELEPKEATA